MGLQTSIVIPNLDSPLVAATLQALQQQEADPSSYEIIVVGRDRPGLVPRDGSVVFVETDHPVGPGEARNRGISAAKGERLLFTDADCRPMGNWMEQLCSALKRSPVVGGSVRFPLTGNRWAVGDNIASFHELLEDRPPGRNQGPVGTLNLGFSRQAWDRVGPFDTALVTSEDYDWFLRARAEGLDVYFEPTAVVEHAPVRSSRPELEAHATWYGNHFLQFCQKHPGAFGKGPTWRSRRALATTRPLKAWFSAIQIFTRHPMLRTAWRALPAVITFKSAWYSAILNSWQDS
jgi:GT2 family glycosyltransferase